VGRKFLIIEASRLYPARQTHAHSVGLLWTSDQPIAQTSDDTQNSKQTDINAPGVMRTCNPRNQAAEDPRLRPRGHWDRQIG